MLREIYGIIVAVLLFYNKLCVDLEKIGFDFNPYNPCVANRIKFDKQHTVIFHVEHVIPSHVKPKGDDKFKKWMNRNYGKHGEVKANRRKLHKYLGIIFEFT